MDEGVYINQEGEDEVKYIYRPETLISQHTGRPTTEDAVLTTPKFWCGICEIPLDSIVNARQHILGKSHALKIAVKRELLCPENTNRVRLQSGWAEWPVAVAEGSKDTVQSESGKGYAAWPQPSKEIKCDDCNLVFYKEMTALQHFKGKKHTTKVAKLALQNKRGVLVDAPGGGNRGKPGRMAKSKGKPKPPLSAINNQRGFRNNTNSNFVSGESFGQFMNTSMSYTGNLDNSSYMDKSYMDKSYMDKSYMDNSYSSSTSNDYNSNYSNNNIDNFYRKDMGDNYNSNYSNNSYDNGHYDVGAGVQSPYSSSYNDEQNQPLNRDGYYGEMKNEIAGEIYSLKRRLNDI